MNPLDVATQFFFNNIFFFLLFGFGIFFILTYLKFSQKSKYKIIDREEVERQKFIDMMRFNKPNRFKSVYTANIHYFNGGDGLIHNPVITNEEKLGVIQNYMEFESVPIKIVERQGIVTYEEEKNEEAMKLIGMVIKEPLFWIIPNFMKKPYPMIIENKEPTIRDEKKQRIIIPKDLGFDKFMGFYYAINENTKPKLRNILDARVLVTDFNTMASRYFAKSQEQAVYSPELAMQLATLEKNLQIELAKKQGKSQTL